ncbi:oligosaccharide flippase family protein [Wohlfahrtiimonas sp. G9077]|uniref:oligosaccharide flippase family protein n=1 Tax=Wohlfahrtiimonas sp. G9077 TaxID=1980118 RepID=UPI000B982B5F|nr:oligosaccharide flippase family protein [Wohlfahrtiimonas sp. G9077]OYQ72533.1 polysaccharide biosynthesis protein [Wohlfahrtiimonas sp. G9077]
MKHNLLANYISQIYTALIGILILPLYVQYMGAEAYGLIGFFTMMQSIFMLLDLGLTPTISRETARYQAKAILPLEFKQLYKVLHLLFIAIAVVGGGVLITLSSYIADHWLTIEELNVSDVIFSIQVMSISIALRWVSGLYKGIITGSEKIAWISYFNIIIATLRFIAVFVVMYIWGYTIKVYFIYQLIIAIIEFIGMRYKAVTTLSLPIQSIKLSLAPIKPILKFTLTIAFTSAVWVLITQSDKFILSGILPLDQYGYFILAVSLASGLTIISGPISTVIMPRMAHLHAQNNNKGLISTYEKATQMITIIIGSAAITLIVMAKETLIAWTNNPVIIEESSSILQLYTFGNALLAWNAFPYYWQYAHGNLKYHLLSNIFTVIILIPSIIIFAHAYGAIGTGFVWTILNIVTLLFWTPFVHKKIGYDYHFKWFFHYILKTIIPTAIIVYLISLLLPLSLNRWVNLFYVTLISIVTLIITFSLSNFRSEAIQYAKLKFKH